jgi:peptidyl-prolyl cis-trans isomerase B (cyclophilin B)
MQISFQRLIVVSVLLGALMLGGCDSPKQNQAATLTSSPSATTTTSPSATTTTSPNPNINKFPGLPRLNGKATVVMTVKGKPIAIELDGNTAPISAGNFVDLVQRKFYDGLTFHRVESNFVVQGGDPKGNGTGGYIPTGSTSERRIPLELKPNSAGEIVYSQTIGEVPKLQHKRGAIAMARAKFPDSASSQFYFTLADVPYLDGNYAVFGKIVQGLEVIDSIQKGDKITSAKVTQGIENLKK